jgi:tRNA A37 threonylcarbamoyltransferase TsaD
MAEWLPICDIEQDLVATLKSKRRLIISAPTGSGKSTQVPQMLLHHGSLGDGQVVVLQPRRLGVHCVTASGGVTCNRALRRELAAACSRHGLALRLAERSLCTDNAAMIGILAERKLLRNEAAPDLDEEIQPGWALA